MPSPLSLLRESSRDPSPDSGLGWWALPPQAPGNPPFIPWPLLDAPLCLCPRGATHPPMPTMYFISAWRAGRDCTWPAYSQAPRWVSPLSELRPSFIEKTWYFYRPWQPGGHPRGGSPRPMGSAAPRVGAHFHQMEIAPRCLLPKLVTGQQDGGVWVDVTPAASSLLLLPSPSQTAHRADGTTHLPSLKISCPVCPLA